MLLLFCGLSSSTGWYPSRPFEVNPPGIDQTTVESVKSSRTVERALYTRGARRIESSESNNVRVTLTDNVDEYEYGRYLLKLQRTS